MISAPQLKNTLSFEALAPGASIVLPHALNNGAVELAPDIIFLPDEGLEVTASDTISITVQNNSLLPITGVILVESWHTIERAFGADANVDLPVKPYIVVSDSTADADRNPMSLPEQWIIEGVGGEGAETGTMNAQVSSNFPEVMTIRAGSIVGIRARTVDPVAAGTISATVTLDGVPVALVANILATQNNDKSIAAPGVIPYGAGQLIGIQWETSEDIQGPITMEAWIEVFEIV